jgi:dienelactone hydrolase
MRVSITLFLPVLVAVVSFQCKSDRGAAPASQVRNGAPAAVTAALTGGENVTITTTDNVVLAGTLYRAAGASAPAVLCLHQWRSDRSTYDALAGALVKGGITVLAIDLRGHGGSVKRSDGSAVPPDRLAGKDVAAAMAFLKKQKGVDPARIGIVGASYGASNALIHAAANTDVAALALLSPGVNYFNVLPTEDAIKRYTGRPLFLAASSDDLRSADAVALYRRVREDAVVRDLKKAGHGTEMLASSPALFEDIVAFLKKNL